jgi:formylglycine-generating enzyme required for sulfatase activity
VWGLHWREACGPRSPVLLEPRRTSWYPLNHGNTMEEWKKAAMPVRGEYPWGKEDLDPERANFDRHVGAPTPVGIYPAGVGPSGHLDIAGNVWEWCFDKVVGPDANDIEDRHYVKGGGWLGSPVNLRPTCRFGSPARNRNGVFGFRLAASPASLDD